MIPCKECLCIPICRHKSYFHLLEDCPSLHRYLYRETVDGEHFKFKLTAIGYKLSPTDWKPGTIYRGSKLIGGIASI